MRQRLIMKTTIVQGALVFSLLFFNGAPTFSAQVVAVEARSHAEISNAWSNTLATLLNTTELRSQLDGLIRSPNMQAYPLSAYNDLWGDVTTSLETQGYRPETLLIRPEPGKLLFQNVQHKV